MSNDETSTRRDWFYRRDDRIAYFAAFIYSIPFVNWCISLVLEDFGLQRFPLFGILMPSVALCLFCITQLLTIFRFSLLANIVAVGTIVFWFCLVWYIVLRGSVSV